jgi:sialate O-acetylesterase
MRRLTDSSAWLIVALVLVSGVARADVKLPKIFGDHMVLQQKTEAAVWGWADAGEQVTVTLGEASATAETGENGRWSVRLPTQEAGGPHTLTVSGKNTIQLEDVLLGDVWIGSGQSNMQWSVAQSDNPQDEIAAANYPQIRLFTVTRSIAQRPLDDCEGQWQVCTPESVAGFSAVLYYYGRHLHRELGIPMGLINTSWGGTIAEAWTSHETLVSDPDFQPILDRSADFRQDTPNQASVLFNGMINPLLPFSIRGAIWYQGESNVQRAVQYQKLFPAMIADWRKHWGQGDFPFYFVQLAPFRYRNLDPRMCAELWEAQRLTLKNVPQTGMAVTTDIGNVEDIHPKNKQDVGLRLAHWALANTYGREGIVYSGPLYESMEVDGNKVRLKFTHVGSGLVSSDGEPLSHFTIAGADGEFVPAEAEIDGATVLVSSEAVAEPVAVRFAWRDDAEPNFGNQEGLPASPFRTDEFPLLTAENK